MSKYDNLDARKEIEQEITRDLKKAFEKRGFHIKHNGSDTSHAIAGKPDIEMWDDNTHINIEITKSTKSSQDREWQSIKDHYEETKRLIQQAIALFGLSHLRHTIERLIQ